MYFMRVLFLLIVVMTGAAATRAGGFQQGHHSARALGLGGAFVAMPDDASSLYANPSIVSFLNGTHLSIGTTIIMPETRFTLATEPDNTSKTQSQVLFPPNVSLTHTFGDGIGLGVSATVPFYIKNEWPADWTAGRVTTRSEIRVVFISPTVSAKIFPSLSMGLSLNVAFSHLQNSRRIGFEQMLPPEAPVPPDGTQAMDGSGETSFGFGAGLFFHPDDVWSLGVAYRGRISVPVEGGSVSFTGIPADQAANYPDGTYSTAMTIPGHISAGIGCRPIDALYLSGEVQYMYWSALSTTTFIFADPALQANPNVEKVIPLHWRNSVTVRGGMEFTVGSVSLRAGFAYEQTPVPDQYLRPSVPDVNRKVYSGGIGYAVSEALRLDFACSFTRFDERSISSSLVEYLPGAFLNGTYAASFTMIGINMSYAWN
jgi:long-chain fatty acid transport protein